MQLRHRHVYFAARLAGFVSVPWFVSGCGGGRPTPLGPAVGTGTVALHVAWPDVESRGRLMPSASKAIKFEVFPSGSQTAERSTTVARPASQGTLADVSAGQVTLRATAYPNADATGVAQAKADKAITVVAGQTTTERITLASAINRIELTPPSPSVTAGQSVQLTATARDSGGSVVLLSMSSVHWGSSNKAVASVDTSGKVTGIAVGSAQITATDAESQKSGTLSVMVATGTTLTGGMIFGTGKSTQVTIVGGAAYTNEIYLRSPGSRRLLGTNEDSGKVISLGEIPSGVELVFEIVGKGTMGDVFATGPGSRNPDGLVHARVKVLGNGAVEVAFEDRPGGGDQDFNDVVFRVSPVNVI